MFVVVETTFVFEKEEKEEEALQKKKMKSTTKSEAQAFFLATQFSTFKTNSTNWFGRKWQKKACTLTPSSSHLNICSLDCTIPTITTGHTWEGPHFRLFARKYEKNQKLAAMLMKIFHVILLSQVCHWKKMIKAFKIGSKAKSGTLEPFLFHSQVPIWLVHSWIYFGKFWPYFMFLPPVHGKTTF